MVKKKVVTSGFVYIWFDRKHKRFYVGSHWGSTTDGYICSSTWMKNSYKRRPQDFKRRVIEHISTTRQELYECEYKWLSLIPKEQLGKRYYNLKKSMHGSIEYTEEVLEKMSAPNRNKTPSPETIAKRSASLKITMSTPEKKLELSAQATAIWAIPGHRESQVERMKSEWADTEKRESRIENLTAALNKPETIQKISEASLKNWQDPDYRQLVAESKVGLIIQSRSEKQNLNNSLAQSKLWATEEHKQKMIASHLNSEVATASSKANIKKTHSPEAKAKSKETNRLRREREAEIRAADPIAAAAYAKKIKDDARARSMKRWHPELTA